MLEWKGEQDGDEERVVQENKYKKTIKKAQACERINSSDHNANQSVPSEPCQQSKTKKRVQKANMNGWLLQEGQSEKGEGVKKEGERG